MKKKIESYQGAAGGWGAVKSVANAVRKQMDIRQDVIAMFDMNKPEGFDCPGSGHAHPGQILSTVRHSTFVKTAQKQSPGKSRISR